MQKLVASMMIRALILTYLICAVVSICPDGWVRYGNSCYYFAYSDSERVTWFEAEQECAWKNSHLVTIETDDENQFIERHLAASIHSSQYEIDQFWTYGNDIHDENHWNWGNTPNRITTSFWSPGEPNRFNGTDEDCLAIYGRANLQWNDLPCHFLRYFICELEDVIGASVVG